MITGFNTDVQHDGVTYHVQTEDKGLDSPLILSLVYVGGAIIASKRTPYEDLVGRGFDEQALTERLQRQHKLICAAIKAGRVNELKRMNAQNGGAQQAPSETPATDAPSVAVESVGVKRIGHEAEPNLAAAPPGHLPSLNAVAAPVQPSQEGAPPVFEPPQAEAEAPLSVPAEAVKAEPEIVILGTPSDEIAALGVASSSPETRPISPPPAEPFVRDTTASPVSTQFGAEVMPILEAEILESPDEVSEELYVGLLDDEGEFRAGQLVTIKVYVGRGTYGQRPEAFASVTVKVLGTSFRPLILNTDTDLHGVGVVRALLPPFSSGRAAIIIKAVAGEDTAEIRRIIHQ